MLANLDPLILARMQFGFTVAFHIVFPAFSIGLASFLAVLEGPVAGHRAPGLYGFVQAIGSRYSRSPSPWASYRGWSCRTSSARIGRSSPTRPDRCIGPMMAYEVLTRPSSWRRASSGVMLFGMEQGRAARSTTLATLHGGVRDVAVSAFWILSVNSAGCRRRPATASQRRRASFVPLDWWADRVQPVLPRTASCTWCWRLVPDHRPGGRRGRRLAPAARQRANPAARTMFSMAMWMAALVAPVQIFAMGDASRAQHPGAPARQGHGAMEGHLPRAIRPGGAPLVLFGLPNHGLRQRSDYAVEVPNAVLAGA